MFQQLNRFQQGGTLYDYLKSTGRKGSAAYNEGRKALAQQFGIDNYTGTAEQNIQLLNHLHARDGVDSLYPDLPKVQPYSSRRSTPFGGSPMIDAKDIPAEDRNSYPKHNVKVNTPSSPSQKPTTLSDFLQSTPNTTFNHSLSSTISASDYGVNNNPNRMNRNEQYAADNGMRFDPQTGIVSPLFNANSQGYKMLHGAGDVTGDAINLAATLDGAGAVGALGKQGFKKLVKTIATNAPTKVNPALIGNVAKGIRGEVAGAINEAEGMSPALRNIWDNLNYSEVPLNSQRQANTITEQLLRNTDARQELQGIANQGIKTNNFGNLPNRAQKIALKQKMMNSLEPMYQQGGGFQATNPYKSYNTDYDSIPDYLYYSKAAIENNQEGMNNALRHITGIRGQQTATDMQFLGRDLQHASLNDLAKRNVNSTTNPQMKQFYSMVNENPNLLNSFQMNTPQRNDIVKEQNGGNFNAMQPRMKKKGGWIKTKMQNPYN